ncbi:MAG: hypothetical protein LBT11_00150 [Treponema sp.]|jgi:hypothetical protein|nr:hypothetical protein [Treponema sp.]
MKFRYTLALGMALTAALPALAQSKNIPQVTESEYYYRSVGIEKVYPCDEGYVVSYQQGLNKLVNVYIPMAWFYELSNGRGEIVYLKSGAMWPHLDIYYKNGEFAKVRLYLRRDRRHITWGSVRPGLDLGSYFAGVESISLEF